MKRILISLMCMIFIITFVSADLNLWNSVIEDRSNNLVKYHAFYQFDDTSLKGIGKNKDIPVTLSYDVEALPYNLNPYSGEVDWCNFSTSHFKNDYDTDGNLINSTLIRTDNYFANSSFTTGVITINVKSSDYIIADMSCHYTDVNSLYVENALIGRFTTFMPSFECDGCDKYSLEQLSEQTQKNEETAQNELEVYDRVQSVVDFNYTFWLILSWIIKISFIILSIVLIFLTGYYFYKYLKDLERSI